jgi:hypothetical protein
MKLSAEWFADLAGVLAPEKSSEKGAERRRLNRVQLCTRVPLSPIIKGERLPAVPIMVRDFSPRGIRVLYPEPMARGQQFIVDLKGSESTVSLLCTALHSRRVANGLHSVGAEFTCTIPGKTNPNAPDATAVNRIRASILE